MRVIQDRTHHTVQLAHPADISGWREAAQALDNAGVAAERIIWSVKGSETDLFSHDASLDLPFAKTALRTVPRAFVKLTESMLLHRDVERFALAYRILWRLRSEPHLMKIGTDPDIARAHAMDKAVRRDMHKMKAFVRFKRVELPGGGEVFIAWFEPDHHVTAATAPFFMRRFAAMRWSILTPEASAHWDGSDLTIAGGALKSDAPDEDVLEDAWRTYFASIFNPARLKIKAMTAEMPKKYWRNLPEAQLIEPLIRQARSRTDTMITAPATIAARRSPYIVNDGAGEKEDGTLNDLFANEIASLEDLAEAEAGCRRCPLYRDATQVVPGAGPRDADMMIVGEQPGDQEDLAGKPFVGPAGKVFDAAMERVGIDRNGCFITNAVKHFKFEPRGKRRIHKRPDVSEIDHCRWWLDQERRLVQPKLIVAMGATAARGVLGKAVTIGKVRSEIMPLADGMHGLVTVHPSYLLRIEEEARKKTEWRAFLADLTLARDWLAGHSA